MNILFVVSSVFPYESAYSTRVCNFSKLITSLGHKVHVIADTTKEKNVEDKIVDLGYCTYQIIYTKSPTRYERYFVGKQSIKAIKKYLNNNKVDAVICSSCRDRFWRLKLLFNRKNIPFYVDQCEWFDPSNFRFGKLDPRYLHMLRLINRDYARCNGIIAISRLFEEHYKKLGVKVIRIPTILDVANTEWNETNNNRKCKIVYTGSLGISKEYLGPIIAALANNDVLRDNIEFHIYGPSHEEVLSNICNDKILLDNTSNCVFIHGKVPQAQMQKIQSEADYMIFLRPNRRSSDAGFPTKLAESMAVGTPVITNNTGDIGLYLKTGINGFLIADYSQQEVERILLSVINLTSSEKKIMRINCRQTATTAFDYRQYKEVFSSFLMKDIGK